MNVWLALLGIVLVIVLGAAGLFSGEVKRVMEDPEIKREIERRRAEEKRKQDWKDKLK